MKWGKGILSKNVYGIDGAYGTNNGRVVGDMTNENAKWVDFNTKGHNSSTMDFHYEMSIPLSELGTDAATVAKSGLGVQLVATIGKSGMDSLPYDLAENDNADKDDSAGSQENNSFEKSDEDNFTVPFARIGAKDSGSTGGSGSGGSTTVPVSSVAISGDGVSNGALSLEKGKSAQLSVSVSPSNATSRTVTWSSSDASVASVTGTGNVSAVKAVTATVTATAGGKSALVKVTVTEPSSQRFSDVPSSALWYSDIEWLASVGITKGNADGTFRGGDKLSRQDMAVFLHRLDGRSSGTDTSVSSLSISGDGVSNGKLTLDKGKSVQLSAVNVPSDASTVTWWSDDDAVAVTGTGLVIGVKAGSGVVHVQAVTVRCADGHGEVARFPGVVAAGSRYRRGRLQPIPRRMRG